MKKIILFLVAGLGIAATGLTNAPSGNITFTDANLKCFDGKVEIGIYEPNENLRAWGGEGFTLSQVAKQNITIKIRRNGKVFEFKDMTVAIEDGAGNVQYSMISADLRLNGEALDVLTIAALDYDHETGMLNGHYSITNENLEDEITTYRRNHLPMDKMDCYTYTYGEGAN